MALTKLTRLEDIPRMVLSLCGKNGSGKTHLALTSPQPIAWFAIDPGLEGTVKKFIDMKLDIEVGEYYFDIREGNVEEWSATYSELETDLYEAIYSDRFRTIAIDRFDLHYDLIRLARFGKLTGISQFKYPEIYKELRAIINAILQKTDKNLILLSGMDKRRHPEVIDGVTEQVWDGVSYARKGWKDVEEAVQVVAEITLDDEGRFLSVYKCRQKDELRSEEIKKPSFMKLARMMFPNVDRKEFGPCMNLKKAKEDAEKRVKALKSSKKKRRLL